MSTDANVSLSGLTQATRDAFTGPAQSVFVDRLANILRALMQGFGETLAIQVDLDQKTITYIKGGQLAVFDAVNALELELDGSGATDWEVFKAPVESKTNLTAAWIPRFHSFSVSETQHGAGLGAVLTPAQGKSSLTSLLEKLHNEDAKYMLITQQTVAELSVHGSVDADFEEGMIYVSSAVQAAGAAWFDAIDGAADDSFSYAGGDPSGDAVEVPVEAFGL